VHAAVGQTDQFTYVGFTTGVRTTQGQAPFGHMVQAYITYAHKLRSFLFNDHWMRLFNARQTYLLSGPNTRKLIFI
jgi:hypothetical protein